MTSTDTRPTNPVTPRRGTHPGSGGRIVAIVIGCVLVLFGVNLLAGGGILRWAEHQQDADGYYTAGPGRFSTPAYAMTVPSLDVAATGPDVIYQRALLGDLRLQAAPTGDDALFVGVGPSDRVAEYLGGVAHDEITDVDLGLFGARYRAHRGGGPAGAPAAQTFWAASATGPGALDLRWPIESGDWTIVVMNADGTADVRAEVTGGLTMPVIRIIAITSYVAGGVLLLVGLLLLVPATMRERRTRYVAA